VQLVISQYNIYPILTDQLSQNLTSRFEYNIDELKIKMSRLYIETTGGMYGRSKDNKP